MTKLVFGFYGLPFSQIVMTMYCLVIIWNRVQKLIESNIKLEAIWKKCNVIIAFGIVVAIIAATILERRGSSELILIPFYSFIEAQIQPEIYRSMLMNVFLFVPLGLALPIVLPRICKHKVLFTIVFAFLFSFTIEFLQYYYHLGRAETDDVICNTLGAAIGTLSYTIERKFFNK